MDKEAKRVIEETKRYVRQGKSRGIRQARNMLSYQKGTASKFWASGEVPETSLSVYARREGADIWSHPEAYEPGKSSSKTGYAIGVANTLIKDAKRMSPVKGFYNQLLAAKIYALIGEPERINTERLMNSYERAREEDIRVEHQREDVQGLVRSKERSNLEKATATASIVGVLGGIFFLSTNITGNAIADMTTKTTSFLGAGLLIVGLVAGFFWVKSRKSN
jgi:hypothetical protein